MKVVNFVLGLATAVILAALITLGITAFYPAPVAPSYPNTAVVAPVVPCPSNEPRACRTTQRSRRSSRPRRISTTMRRQRTRTQMQVYDRNLFIIANIVGIVVFAVGFWLIFGGMRSRRTRCPSASCSRDCGASSRLRARMGER